MTETGFSSCNWCLRDMFQCVFKFQGQKNHYLQNLLTIILKRVNTVNSFLFLPLPHIMWGWRSIFSYHKDKDLAWVLQAVPCLTSPLLGLNLHIFISTSHYVSTFGASFNSPIFVSIICSLLWFIMKFWFSIPKNAVKYTWDVNIVMLSYLFRTQYKTNLYSKYARTRFASWNIHLINNAVDNL